MGLLSIDDIFQWQKKKLEALIGIYEEEITKHAKHEKEIRELVEKHGESAYKEQVLGFIRSIPRIKKADREWKKENPIEKLLQTK